MNEDNIAIYVDHVELRRRGGAFSLSLSDLTFYKYEVAYIAGENGSGKSTLMRMLALEEEPQSGNIWIAGKQVIGLSGKEKADHMGGAITYIPQAGMGLNKMSPVENITGILQDFDGLDKRQAERVALAALSQVGLKKEQCSRSVRKLSGGQKARVAVAKAIAVGRPIILADEIFKEIDPASVLHIMRLFQDLAKRGFAIIVIGHLPKEHERYFHRIVRLSGGRIVDQMPQAAISVTASPQQPSAPPDWTPLRSFESRRLQRLLGGAALLAAMLIFLFVWSQQLSLFADEHPTPTAPTQRLAAPTAQATQASAAAPTSVLADRPTQAVALVEDNGGPPTAMASSSLANTTDPPTTAPSASLAITPAIAGNVPVSAPPTAFVATAPTSQPSIPITGGQTPLAGESPLIVPGGPPTTDGQAPPAGESTLVVSDEPPTAGSGPIEITRDPSAWSGGYYRGDSDWCGQPWVAVYAAETPDSRATLDISLSSAPAGTAQLLLTGMGDELSTQTQIEITVNGQSIFSGPSPFPHWDGQNDCANPTWTTIPMEFPADLLHAGNNQITIVNLETSGAVGEPPYVMLGTTVLRLSD